MKSTDYSSYYRLTSPDKPNRYWLALTLILITGVSLRLPNLNESLWNDEIWSTHVLIGVADASESKRPGSFGRTFVKSLAAACIVAVILLSVFTLKEYFRRDEEWTVYKPNPDWRSAARYLESGINASSNGSSGPLAIFAAVPPLELTYYNSRFKNIWLGLVDGQDALTGEESRAYWEIYSIGPAYLKNFEKFHDALSRTGAQAFYLIHNKYWGGDFDRVFENLMKDPRIRYQTMQSFKGIEIHEFKTVPRA